MHMACTHGEGARLAMVALIRCTLSDVHFAGNSDWWPRGRPLLPSVCVGMISAVMNMGTNQRRKI